MPGAAPQCRRKARDRAEGLEKPVRRATSAKGSLHEDPGPDLASYPLSAVPDEAAAIVRALAT